MKDHHNTTRSGFWPTLASLMTQGAKITVGGQAVMEGVMMRSGEHYGLAVRRPDGTIVAERKPWFTLAKSPFMKRRFIRGCPILIETMVNGIKSLNRSAEQAFDETVDESGKPEGELKPWHLVLTMIVSILMAIGLFVVLPHAFSIAMKWLGLGGDVDGLSFHIWDGFFKFAIFIGYILAISFVPDIRRVFQYHGAEHKTIRAFEAPSQTDDGEISAIVAAKYSRLHPRCGTTFMLFVLSIAIILHAILVPALMLIWTPENTIAKHAVTIFFKLVLMLPISAIAYEVIRYSACLGDGLFSNMLKAPGMLLQRLTTKEPDEAQLEVAIVALKEALGDDAPTTIRTAAYSPME